MFTEQTIKRFEQIGLRPLGIYLPGNAAGLSWSKAYPDPEYRLSTTTLPIKQDRYTFENCATMLGRTHIKDPETGEFLNLNVLDTDCPTVRNHLSVPIEQLLSGSTWDWVTPKLQDLVRAFLSSTGVVNGDYSLNLLDVLKRSTFVIKTRKEYGYHNYWFSRQQRKAIGTAACRAGFEFEIKTDESLGLCTLPGSAHKDDPNFRYEAVGINDHILTSDILYDLFVEMFKDCIVNGKLDDTIEEKDVNKESKSGAKAKAESNSQAAEAEAEFESESDQQQRIKLYDLSPGAVKATAGYLSDLIVVGYRHFFYVYFTGMLFHHRISLKSGLETVSLLCDITKDEEKKNRLESLRLTYEKGLEGKPLKGAPSLGGLISSTVDSFKDNKKGAAKVILEILRKIWSKDISLEGLYNEGDKKLSQQIIEMLRPRISLLFKDGSDTAFAAINTDEEYRYTVPIHKSKRFNLWIRKTYYELANDTLGSEILNEIADTLEAEALFEGPIKNLEPRIANDPDGPLVYWYDLGNEQWNAIKITPYGWSIVESKNTPIVFRRYAGQLAQALPIKEYPKDIFEQFMKLLNIKDDSDIRLVYQCYVVSLLIPGIGKAVFSVQGPQGAAKTTCQDLTKSVVDPSKATNLSPPTREEQLIQQLQHNLIIFYDNLSHMPEWLSNALCRAATGTASAKRELYTNDDDVIYQYKRAVGFNGITLAANRADLLDRSFIVEIEAVPDEKRRLLEGDILPELERIRPQLFGFILDTLVRMLRLKAGGGIKLKTISRMADFEMNCEMISRCLGHEPLKFVDAYRNNKKIGTTEILETSSTANALIEFMKDRNAWTGYASQLLNELVTVAITKLKIDTQKDKGWPKSGSYLSRRLRELKNSLLDAGIQVFWVDNAAENRKTLNIVKVQPVQPVQPAACDSNTSKTDCTGGTGPTCGTFAKSEEEPQPASPRIYRLYPGSDRWGCQNCNIEGDKWLMQDHQCRDNKK